MKKTIKRLNICGCAVPQVYKKLGSEIDVDMKRIISRSTMKCQHCGRLQTNVMLVEADLGNKKEYVPFLLFVAEDVVAISKE